MTQVKYKKDNVDKKSNLNEDNQKKSSNPQPACITDNCITICAWILLTMGLCILVTTFYLAIRQRKREDTSSSHGETFFISDIGNVDAIMELDNTFSTRSIDDNAYSTYNVNFTGCQEVACKIACSNSVNIFDALHDVVTTSSCSSTDILVIDSQDFPGDVLKNSWCRSKRPIYELFIMKSKICKIKSGAFNTPLFASTILLTLHELNLRKVESGALLGLFSLRFLTIDTNLPALDRSFFQPVQTTLTHLKLQAGLQIAGNVSIFGNSDMQKLELIDLSNNYFDGPLTKNMFNATPKLKYLIMSSSKLTSIEDDAFEQLAGNLLQLNLEENMLTTLSSNVLAPILAMNSRSYISIGTNKWNCDCDLHELAGVYKEYRVQFVNSLYCKNPHSLYGTFLDKVDFQQQGCGLEQNKDYSSTTTASNIHESDESVFPDDDNATSEDLSSKEAAVFQMRCLNTFESNSKSLSTIFNKESSTEMDSGTGAIFNVDLSSSGESLNQEIMSAADLEYIHFEPPCHEFQVLLLPNNSAEIRIVDYKSENPVNIIWFSDETETLDLTHAGENIDYNCAGYEDPYMIIDNLVMNTTYTFCLIPNNEYTVTPFNCLPLHVPLLRRGNENMWISTDDKQFTVGIICLIFTLSLFFGAIVAYFGIKNYPDLLEGSKNVLVVKKSEQTCYVSTITECEYLKNSSMKKKPLSGKGSLKRNSMKIPLPETPTSNPTMTQNMPVKGLERLCSQKSSSTCFEDSFVLMPPFSEDEYEMPINFEKRHNCEVRCVPNNYATSPASPPPLPKRNSNISNNLNLVVNRFPKSNN